jgi:hypothetical protein
VEIENLLRETPRRELGARRAQEDLDDRDGQEDGEGR